MKKITLLLTLLFCALSGYAQPLSEDFESGIPADWLVQIGSNGLGGSAQWEISPDGVAAHSGTKAAYINTANIGTGNSEEDWLITRASVVPADGQLRFFNRQMQIGNQNTVYQLRIAVVSTSGPNQGTLTDYATIKEWNEQEISNPGDLSSYEERFVDIPSEYIGQNVYFAFVRLFTQPTPARGGDRWLVDDVRVVPRCKNPSELDIVHSFTTATSAQLTWNGGGAGAWEVMVLPEGNLPVGAGTLVTTTTVNTDALPNSPLSPGSTYVYFVRSACPGSQPSDPPVYSDWIGPLTFLTLPLGSVCASPIVATSPTYQTSGNTSVYGDHFDTAQGGSGSLCGATPAGTNYLGGNDVFYSYTASASGVISITMTPQGSTSTNSSVFVYNSCSSLSANCLAGLANSNTTARVVNLTVEAGQTYIIVISSSATTQSIAYNLLIQQENCTPKPTALTASAATIDGATLSWTDTEAHSSWEVSVQPLGQGVPAGAGTDTVTGGIATLVKTGLNAGTQYQYWVRAECTPGSGIYTAWAGPFPFDTKICEAENTCSYILKMGDSANNGWNGARMQIRQNNIVVATIGATFTSGGTAPDVPVSLCSGVPFDVYWLTAGTAPQQCTLKVLNSFGQTIYTKPAGTGTAGSVIYSDTAVKCDAPVCNIAPDSISVSNITTVGATISWVAPATTSWDIFVYPVGSPMPSEPTYNDITVADVANPSFITTAPLIPDMPYNVCVRVNCDPVPSAVTCTTFTTLPTCPKPVSQSVAGITTTAAALSWVPAPDTNLWEILLIAGPDEPSAPGVNPEVGDGSFLWTTANAAPYTYNADVLQPATIYYYYIRSVCPGDDKSKWTGPVVFHTTTCEEADKCDYKFILTDSGSNGWNGARMIVRQNGIAIQTIGQTLGATAAGPVTVTVKLCTDVPFDLFWSVEGTAPSEVGVQIQSPFTDIIYNKPPGIGAPLTVLYSDNSLGNCTPPSCPKPTTLDVVAENVLQTEAELKWTEAGTATKWEVYVVPVGTAPPVNGTPLNTGVANYYQTTDNPFTVTGLLPGTAYNFYVRALCSDTDISTWTILNPKRFVTKPVNDECLMALDVSVNPVWECSPALSAHGSTLGATLSTPTFTAPAGCPGSDDDVWFKFTATNNIHTIDLNNVVGTNPAGNPVNVTLNYTLFSGTCDNLVRLYCSTTPESVATGLIPGNVYYIRIYSQGTTTNRATFDLCVGTPPPPATNDECATAINVIVNENSKCLHTTAGNIIGATASGGNTACLGTEDDDVWFTFTATNTRHLISLLNLLGTTTNLNHAVYSGSCGALVQKYCSTANSLNSDFSNYVVGETYYLRVWSNVATSQVVTFDVCIKSTSTCANAERFCGSSLDDPYIYENTTGLPGGAAMACLGSTPNPTFYTLHVGQTGNLTFNILQNTQFDAAGLPVGNNLDVDYVAWGPFGSGDQTQNCDDIVFGPCSPVPCPNNTTNANFYPRGNIVDCSFDASFTETLHIPNAQAGEYYVILVTNFSQQPGLIRLVQTNYAAPGAGETICCEVELGPDISVCAENVLLSALTGVQDVDNVPPTFQWFFNGSTTPIPGETGPTYLATQSGTYKVTGNCGLNPVESEIVVILGPVIETTTPPDYGVCDDASNDGIADFNLLTLTPQVLGTLDSTLYTVTYYLTPEEAAIGGPGIDATVPFPSTSQTIYIRVESKALSTCFDVVPVNLVVNSLQKADFSYSSSQYCKDASNPSVTLAAGSVAGQFTSSDGLSIDAATGLINLAASAPGDYTISNTIAATGGCGQIVATFDVKITEPIIALFDFGTGMFCKDGGTATPNFGASNAGPGIFTATPDGLSIDPATGVINLGDSLHGTYQVTNEIAPAGGCLGDIKTVEVIVTEPATGTIAYSSPYCKSSEPATVISTVTPGGSFTAAEGLSIDPATGTINLAQSTPGDYIVFYTIPAFEGCDEFTASAPVTISTESEIDFLSGCDSNDFIISASPSDTSGTYTYSWSGPGFVSGATPDRIVVSQAGTYSVTLTNLDGCQTTESVSVTDISCDIQRGISPNNDGKNESFDLTNLNVRHLSIFNRYGTEVYQSPNYTNQWHGQSNSGESLPDGTYFYVIEKGDGKSKTGWIYINK